MSDFKTMDQLFSDSLSQGERMGFKTGGSVKRMGTMKKKPMKAGNTNVQRKKKMASNQRDKEAGDQGPLRPGFKKGGKKKAKGGKMKHRKGGSCG